MSWSTIAKQPSVPRTMDLYHVYHQLPEKSGHPGACHHDYHPPGVECDNNQGQDQCHSRCHDSRRRRLLFSSAVFSVVFLLLGLVALHCFTDMDLLGFLAGDSLLKRAIGDGSSNGNDFTNRKLYLIVIFVGLFVVVILGICLSAWCCRGSFENPLCCPCYLCACCGGLACLECIGCGLCAEGAEIA